MRPFRVLRIYLAFLCLTATTALAQYTIKNIVFDGKMPYTQAALEAASGLKPGDPISKVGMQQAAQRLTDTGAFDDLQVTLDGPVKAISVIFKVKPIDPSKMLAVDLQNFIWWQPDQLSTELCRRVPLYGDSVPEAGNIQQAIQDALTQMLAEKQIAAKISSRVTDATPSQPLRIVHYRVDSPDIRLRSFKVDNLLPTLAPQANKLLTSLAGSPYNEGSNGRGSTRRILDLYRDAGYLDASFDSLDRNIDNPAADKINVDLVGSIKAEGQYHVAKIVWQGSPQISETEFADSSKLHSSDLASQKELRASLAIIDTAYRRQGYMDVIVDATPQLDSAAHLVTFNVSVNSGAQYHFAELNVLNLTPEARSQLDAAWKLRPGDLYDETYLVSFIKSNIAQPYLLPYSLTYRVERDPDTHTVKLFLIFAHSMK
jgi:outer membrane protein assembly factor BamA